MAALTYPASLPCPTSARYQPTERRGLSSLPGPTRARTLSRDRHATRAITFTFRTFEQVAAFVEWVETDLIKAGAWFAAPLWRLPSRAVGVYRFIEGPSYPQLIPKVGWRVQATVEVRGRGLPPQESVIYRGLGWNPNDAADRGPPFLPHWGISGANNETALHNSGGLSGVLYGGVRAVTSRSVGKLYFEIKLTAINDTYPVYVGAASAGFDLSANPGTISPAAGQYVVYYNVGRIMSSLLPLGPVVTAYNLNDVIGVAVDFAISTVTMYRNGVLKGSNTYSGSPGMFPFLSSEFEFATEGLLRTTANTFQYAPPAGFAPWG